ncbi:hypothetical protein PFISCL1PPCAC_10382 [Pristionchus fissidentatus]|uniref:E3 ubiquitin protein ligase n=1 Tax=Pristionchus fissidentatus TaxID=1538716 RepID=A0AAV5VHD6_9BILA|nr:hypothetical protein PFISCL1PPCAC_10382 [Pristionchus fissidentatus]
MAKRSPSSDAEDNNSAEDDCKPAMHKRQRMIVFEPVRLVGVSGVNDIDERVDRFKLAKLGERLKMQQRQIADRDRTIERLTARQDKDDNTLCMVNRHWNRLDADLALFRSALGVEESTREDADTTNDFLTQIAQMDDDECERVYDARVKHTHQLATNVSETFTRRSEHFASLIKKIKDIINNGAKDKVDISDEVVEKLSDLAENNKNLSRLNQKLLAENRDLSLKMRERDDRIALLETKNEEIKTQLDEKEFEVQKSWRQEEKLERRLGEMAKERNGKKEKSETNGTHPNHCYPSGSGGAGGGGAGHSHRDDDLMKEVETLKEVCANREQEMNEMNEQIANLTSEKEKLSMDLQNLPDEVIKETEEYKCIQTYYTFMVEENQRLKEEKDAVHIQMSEMKKHHMEHVKTMEEEEKMSHQRLLQSSQDIEQRFTKLRKDYEVLRVEFEQTVAASDANGPNAFDYRTTVATLNNQIALMRSDCLKFKQKWKVAVSALSQLQRKTESERIRLQKYVMIPLSEEDIKGLSIGEEEENSPVEEGTVNGTTKDPSVVSKLEKENKMLQASANTLKMSLAKLLKKDDRRQMWNEDALRRISDLEKSMAQCKAELAEKTKEEEGLLNEMDTTGQAFEELQEQNTKLLHNIKEQEETNLKVMSDRIYMLQNQNKMREEKTALDDQITALQNTLHSVRLELNAVRDASKLCNDRLHNLSVQNDQLYGHNEQLRKQQILESKKAAELKISYQKASTQLAEVQQAMKSKSAGHVKDQYRITRLEEEKSVLKRKVERAHKMEEIGSMESVMAEEIKELKDSLTCPSCKVRRKDGILTKCFHVFCMDCLKTRYETRRRKCPKCNAAFGANDFHRVYIG